jgi:glycosyltransferase involved in cell wall biosynthesis
MKPLVSVIVPIYNAAPYLVETLDSIMASTYRPLEVVMVDDGSSDNSLEVAQVYCRQYPECQVMTQENRGVSAARNRAIAHAQGTYILPVDADDKIADTFIEKAVAAIEADDNIRVVGCRCWMFGAVDKEWKLPTFSHALLARKNMIPATALYRKADWERCGGYCEEEIYREDWDFWLSMMELGGTFYKLNEVLFYYRISTGSRRVLAKGRKQFIIDAINRRHPDYLNKYLGGPLHYHRSWSRLINLFRSDKVVGNYSNWDEGEIIYAKRNTLRGHNGFITKQFATPSIWRGMIYGWFIPTKAKRSYLFAQQLQGLTPAPVAYREVRYCGILRESWYVCKESECKYTFNDLIHNKSFPNREKILHAIGLFTVELYQRGVFHQDYSGGNILFNEDGSKIEIIDLNRIRFYKKMPLKKGLQLFERLNIDKKALAVLGATFALPLGLDKDFVIDYIITHRWKKHVKQGITNLYD